MQKCETLYQKIYDTYRERILSGELASGERLPTETQLMTDFSVSRITAKRALDELAGDGYIVRRRGSGSYVSEQTVRTAENKREPLRIAIIVPSAEHETDLFYPMIQGATDYLSDHHGQLICYHSNRDEQTEQKLLLQARADGCDGILYYPGPVETGKDILIRMVAAHYPVVMLDKSLGNALVTSVASDNVGGSCTIMRHVLNKGHRNIAFLSVYGEVTNVAGERYMGCCREVEQNGLSADSLRLMGIFNDQKEMLANIHRYNEAAEERLITLLPRWKAQGITAICTLNDNIAMRVYGAARELGYRIPQDIAVAGFDGAEYGGYVTPGLTTMRQNAYQMGYQGAEALLALVKDPSLPARRILIDTELIVRESV